MTSTYTLAPQAARDLLAIRRYLRQEAGQSTADRVEALIRDRFIYLANFPEAGHWRPDLAPTPLRFLSVHSYMIVYRPEFQPLQIVAIVHGNRDMQRLLSRRFV